MSSSMYGEAAVLMGVIALIAYYAWLFFGPRIKKHSFAAAGLKPDPQSAERLLSSPPALIETAASLKEDTPELSFEQAWEEAQLELVEDEDSLLLKTAEKLVDEVQEIITYHIASFPPNPEEVYTKLKEHLSAYSILRNTEYEDAVNRFIAVTVKRDCELELTEKELSLLWQ